MFSKNEKLESFIGRNTHFKGDISVKGTLRVDGRVTGNVEADWLIMGGKAFLKGNVNATGVVVGGSIEGNMAAKEIVEIKNKGQIKGDVLTGKLVVVEGGMLDGKVTMQREGMANKVVELTSTASSSSEKLKEANSGS